MNGVLVSTILIVETLAEVFFIHRKGAKGGMTEGLCYPYGFLCESSIMKMKCY